MLIKQGLPTAVIRKCESNLTYKAVCLDRPAPPSSVIKHVTCNLVTQLWSRVCTAITESTFRPGDIRFQRQFCLFTLLL